MARGVLQEANERLIATANTSLIGNRLSGEDLDCSTVGENALSILLGDGLVEKVNRESYGQKGTGIRITGRGLEVLRSLGFR